LPPAKALQTMHTLTLSRSRPRAPRELSLWRKSVGALAAGNRCCCHCHRTPLVGENVHVYGDRFVCELCRHLRREAPGHTEIVHSPEHERAVKRRPRAA
jgi:hypothetical protein